MTASEQAPVPPEAEQPPEKKPRRRRRGIEDLVEEMDVDVPPTPPSADGTPPPAPEQPVEPVKPVAEVAVSAPLPAPERELVPAAPTSPALPTPARPPSATASINDLAVTVAVIEEAAERIVRVDFGDGTPPRNTVAGGAVEHIYAEGGQFVITIADVANLNLAAYLPVRIEAQARTVTELLGPPPSMTEQAGRPQPRSQTVGLRVTPAGQAYYMNWLRGMAAKYEVSEKHITARVADRFLASLGECEAAIAEWLDEG